MRGALLLLSLGLLGSCLGPACDAFVQFNSQELNPFTPFKTTMQGDYERQLCKMRVAHERKRALIETLLDAAARHAVLRQVQAGELQWLRELQAAVEGVRALLDSVTGAAAQREGAYGAAAAAAASQQQRSSVAPDDVYLTRMQQLLQPGSANWAAVHAGSSGADVDGRTPQTANARAAAAGGRGAAGGGAPLGTPPPASGSHAPLFNPRSARTTPTGFSSIKDISSGLAGLAAALQTGEGALTTGLFNDLPRRLGEIVVAERKLRNLAFPPMGGAAANAAGGGGGSSSAGSSTELGTPVLTTGALSDAMRALEGLNHSIGGSINRLLQQQQDWATVQKQHAREQQLERRVMAMMFTEPRKLEEAVDHLRGRVQAMEAASGVVEAARV